MYILVVFKKTNLCNIVINIDIIMIICKVFYSVIGFKAMFLCLPVRYCTYVGVKGEGTREAGY